MDESAWLPAPARSSSVRRGYDWLILSPLALGGFVALGMAAATLPEWPPGVFFWAAGDVLAPNPALRDRRRLEEP